MALSVEFGGLFGACIDQVNMVVLRIEGANLLESVKNLPVQV
jgi:hypothetical protein